MKIIGGAYSLALLSQPSHALTTIRELQCMVGALKVYSIYFLAYFLFFIKKIGNIRSYLRVATVVSETTYNQYKC